MGSILKKKKEKAPETSTEKVVSKKAKKAVKFNAEADPKPKEEKPKKKAFVPKLIKETDVAAKDIKASDKIGGKRRSRNRRQANDVKRQKLVDGVIGPKVETVDFTPDQKQFSEFDLDERILKVVGEMGWKYPTQVQESVISLALENKNIMARARTGSGKTAAFLLPTIHKVVQYVSGTSSSGPFALFVAPTKELVTQIHKLINKLLEPLPFLTALNLSELSEDERSVWEKDSPSLVVSTPGKIETMLKMRPDFCQNVRHLVLDEADLLLSFGYEKEMTNLKEKLPPSYQCIFTSATLTDDMTLLKKIFMTGPVVTIKLKEGDLPDADQLAQYQITCMDDEQRFAIMVAMLKLKLIVGKTIIFVNTTDRCYKLSLVLRTFGLKACILNSEMPANSRCHVINQFNEGLFSIIIASDAQDAYADTEGGSTAAPEKEAQVSHKRDKESGVARGIDFHFVSNVVNFDFPISTDVYIHRVGRTARGWNKGTALSFCAPEERPCLDVVQEEINKQMNRKVLMPYEIRIKELDSFVLRTREALTKCSKGAIKYARLREIKLELVRSAKLEGFFAKNPREKDLMATAEQPATLRLHSTGIADVPEYMVPKALRGMDFSTQKKNRSKPGKNYRKRVKSVNQKKHQRSQKDPLKSFKSK